MTYIEGSHHVTLSVGHAQQDVDFHVKTLGLRFIKRTVLFDGSTPVYHLYYSNANGDPSSVVTTFPWAQHGLYGQRGTNQAREVLLSVPAGSLDYWSQRLTEHRLDVNNIDVFDRRRLEFRHPCGIEYQLVENDHDEREGWTGGGVPREYAIHGLHGVGIHVTTLDRMVEFANDTFFSQGRIAEEGDRVDLQVGNAKYGNHIELTPTSPRTKALGATVAAHTTTSPGTSTLSRTKTRRSSRSKAPGTRISLSSKTASTSRASMCGPQAAAFSNSR